MSEHILKYGSTDISFTVTYSERETLGIQVHPDLKVKVIAPTDSSIDQITNKVRQKAPWIIKQQDYFISFHPKTPPRRYISGETHLYLGRQYRLRLIEDSHEAVQLIGGYINVHTTNATDTSRVKTLLEWWYNQKAQIHFPKLFEKAIQLYPIPTTKERTLKTKWMAKRWGSCTHDGTILLNIELIKTPKACIEYVIVHEFCHLAHMNHSKQFYKLLDKVYPEWKSTKMRLENIMV